MSTTILRKSGGSSITTIPSLVCEFLNISVGDRIEWNLVNNQVVVSAVKKKKRAKQTLDQLLDAYEAASPVRTSEDNEWLNGSPCGKELL